MMQRTVQHDRAVKLNEATIPTETTLAPQGHTPFPKWGGIALPKRIPTLTTGSHVPDNRIAYKRECVQICVQRKSKRPIPLENQAFFRGGA